MIIKKRVRDLMIKKIYRIKYKNRIFDVFLNETHQKSFLEVVNDHYEEVRLEDLIYLNNVFNKRDDGVLDLSKQKVKVLGVVIGISFTTMTGVMLEKLKLEDFSSKYQIVKEYNSLEEVENTALVINNNKDLDMLEIEKVSFKDVYGAFRNNKNIPLKYRSYVEEWLNRLEERLPNIDLRVIKMNMENLKFRVLDSNEWDRESTDGYYRSFSNTITIKDKYSSKEREEEVIFHELGHVLNNTYEELYSKDNSIIRSYYIMDSGYGKSLSEGFNTILTDYLLTDEWIGYFDKESRDYGSYSTISSITYQLIKLLDYDLYDYLEGNIVELSNRLKEYDLDNIVDVLDAKLEKREDIKVLEGDSLEEVQEKLLRCRILKKLQEDVGELEVYSMVNKINLCPDTKWNLYNEVIGEQEDWYFRLKEKEKSGNSNIRIYDEKRLLVNSDIQDVFTYYSDKYDSYRLGYVYFNGDTWEYRDAIDSEVIEDECRKIGIEVFLDSSVGFFYKFYDLDMNVSFLESKGWMEYIEEKEKYSSSKIKRK